VALADPSITTYALGKEDAMGLLSDAKLQTEGMKRGIPWSVIKKRRQQGLTGDALLAPMGSYPDSGEPQASTTPELKMKSYKNEKEFNQDSVKMVRDGWTLQGSQEKDRHTAVGRTVGKAVLTGGVGLLLTGRSKKGDAITVTWVRGGESSAAPIAAPTAAAPDLADQLQKLAGLRDQGILTDDEFAAQKAKLLSA
jgi:hypothetical protein